MGPYTSHASNLPTEWLYMGGEYQRHIYHKHCISSILGNLYFSLHLMRHEEEDDNHASVNGRLYVLGNLFNNQVFVTFSYIAYLLPYLSIFKTTASIHNAQIPI